jgi:hypothetical protein
MKVKIGFRDNEEIEYKSNIESKKLAFNSCFEYCNRFLVIEDKIEFAKDFKEYFLNAWEQKYSNSFPPIVSVLKQLELSDCQLHIIEAYQKQYENIAIDFNPSTQKAKDKDFNIYAETPEQIERFNACQSVIEAIEKLQKSGANVLYGSLCQSMQNVLTIDYSTNKLTPVNGFVFNQYR